MRIRAVSLEPSLLAHTKLVHRQRLRPKFTVLGPLGSFCHLRVFNNDIYIYLSRGMSSIQLVVSNVPCPRGLRQVNT